MEEVFVLYITNDLFIGADFINLLKKVNKNTAITSKIEDILDASIVLAYVETDAELTKLLLFLNSQTTFIILHQKNNYLQEFNSNIRIDGFIDINMVSAIEIADILKDSIENRKSKNLIEITQKNAELNQYGLTINSYETVIESLQAGIWDWQIQDGVEKEWWSARTYEILNFTAFEFEPTREKFVALIHPDDLPLLEKEKKRYQKEQGTMRVQLRMRSKNHNYIWIDVTGKGTFSETGEPVRMTGTVVDINIIKNQENKIIAQKTQFENYIENSPTAIFIVQNGNLVYLNPAAKLVMDIEETLPLSFRKFVHSDLETEFFENTEKLVNGKANQVRFIAKLRSNSGKVIFADLTLGITTHNGAEAIIGTGIDITQQKITIDQLKLSEALLNDSQNVTKTGTFTINRVSQEIWWSKQLYKLLLVVENKKLEFDDFYTFIHQEDIDIFRQKILKALEFGFTGSVEFRLRYPENKIIFCQCKFKLIDNGEILQGTIQDVSEYKTFEQKIFEQEQITSEILNSFPIEIVIYNKEMKYEYANKKAIENDELRNFVIGKSDFDYFDKKGMAVSKAKERSQKLEQVIDNKKDINWVEREIIDGKTIFSLRGLFPIIENNEIRKIVGSSLDLTKELEAEESLKFRIGFENLLINISNTLINISSEKLDDVLNDAIREIGEFAQVDRVYIFKYRSFNQTMDNTHEWCSHNTTSFMRQLQDISISEFDWLIRELAKKETIIIDSLDQLPEEAQMVRKEFESENIQSIILVPLVIDKKVNGFIGFDSVKTQRTWSVEIADLLKLTAQIVSSALERRKSLGALVQSEEKFRTLTESAHAGIFISTNSRLVYANPETTKITGFDHDEILTKNIIDLLHPDERSSARETLGKIMASENFNARNERKLITKTGEIRYIDITSNKIQYNGENAMISIAFDVTEKHKKDEERINLINQLTAQNEDLEQFSYITSHNLRSPVAGIKGLVSIIERDKLGSVVNENVIQRIEIAAQKLDSVIKDLNDIIAVKKQFNQIRQTIYFDDVLKEIIEGHAELVNANLVDISADFSEAPKIQTVKAYLQSILTNLITNGVKYSVPGQKPFIKIKTCVNDNFIELSVQDNGLGIDLNKYGKKLFKFKQRFHLNIEGHGIGLYLVKTQAEALGGSVEVESTVNKGSRFIVKLLNYK